jgi:hypothetical protein
LLVLCVMIVTVDALELLCGDVGALELVPLVAGGGELVEGEPELPHAASRAAPPAKIGAAHHRLRMATSPFLLICLKAFLPPLRSPGADRSLDLRGTIRSGGHALA